MPSALSASAPDEVPHPTIAIMKGPVKRILSIRASMRSGLDGSVESQVKLSPPCTGMCDRRLTLRYKRLHIPHGGSNSLLGPSFLMQANQSGHACNLLSAMG